MCLALLIVVALSVMKWREFHFWGQELYAQRILEVTLLVNALKILEAPPLLGSQGLKCLHSIINLFASRENNRKTSINLSNQEVFQTVRWLVAQILSQILNFVPQTWLLALQTSSISQQEILTLSSKHLLLTQQWLRKSSLKTGLCRLNSPIPIMVPLLIYI